MEGRVTIHGRGERSPFCSMVGLRVGRDEDDAVHGDAELRLQVVGDAGAAESAVAFADEVFAGVEAVVLDEPVVDDAREVLDVGLGGRRRGLRVWSASTRERLKPVPMGSMKTRSVKSSQVPGLSVRVAGSEGLSPSVADVGMLGADGAEVEIDRSCAGSAIEGEGDGAVGARRRCRRCRRPRRRLCLRRSRTRRVPTVTV